jgi:hypothetical protein
MATTKNMQSKPINQKRGPTTGNGDNGTKRQDFIRAKQDGGNERTALADFVMDAVAARGMNTKPHIMPGVENLNSSSSKSTGISRNPTAGGTLYNQKSRTPGKITKR